MDLNKYGMLKLHGDGISAENIASELEMSKSLGPAVRRDYQ
jgi:hypothetical protein